MAPSDLESVSRNLESSLDCWGLLILVSTGVVVLGLVIEYREPVRDFIEQCRRPAAAFPWKTFVGLGGGILVTIGVAGELGFTYKASRVVTRLRENNHKIEESLNLSTETAAKAAERAKASADGAKQKADAVSKQADALTLRMKHASRQLGVLEQDVVAQGPRAKLLEKARPELVRQLAPFAGQRVKLFVCGQPWKPESADQETRDTWGEIAFILGKDGARWNAVGLGNASPFVKCGIGRGSGQQITVFVSEAASEHTLEVAKALSDGLSKTLPAPGSQLEPVPNILRERPDNDEYAAPYKSVAMDSDLITVLVGAHPQP